MVSSHHSYAERRLYRVPPPAPGTSHEAVAALAPKLAVALGVDEVEIRKTGPRSASLTARMPLPVWLPTYPPQVVGGLVPPRTPPSVPLGLNADGYPVELPLFDDAGGRVTLISGSPGTGKSSALRLVLAGLSHTHTAIVWLDPKGGADAGPFADRVEVVATAINALDALAVLRQLNALIVRRTTALGQGHSLATVQPVVVIVDEWAALGVDGEKAERADVQAELRRIAATGRAARVSLILATQRPTSTTIDVATRGLASGRLCFAVGDQHAALAAGMPGAEQLNPVSDRATCLLDLGSGTQKVKLYAVPENLCEVTSSDCGLATALTDLACLEVSALRTS